MLEFTAAAVKEIKRMQSSRQKTDSYFRLSVKQGGCSGLCYTFELCEAPLENDRHYQIRGIAVLIDQSNLPYLKQLRLDYAEDLMGGGFRFHNPQISTPCSCGLSFAPSA
ncbi:MAG TPA: iron-sulfur cluster assembly accessory protein [Cyanothece sp. UBA12306]|nr:iron-sulfur cluster assembly accessory protein [Cyanothece sp. UBA12306]